MPHRPRYKWNLLCALVGLFVIASCGAFDDKEKSEPKQEPPQKSEQNQKPDKEPSQQNPEPQKQPVPEQKVEQKPNEQKYNELCEAERQWAYTSGLIDAAQLRLFRNRNLAPVFVEPGLRQSGIEIWVQCPQALRLNGFVK